MATVVFNQATDMAALPTSLTSASGTGNNSEIDFRGSNGAVFCLGSFTLVGLALTGTMTRTVIDQGDFGSFPNLDISGASFAMSGTFYINNLSAGNLSSLVANMLEADDVLLASAGADGVLGFAGNDTLVGGAGGDVLDGGLGANTASYFNADAGVVANLANPTGNTGHAAGDSYVSIQNLTGSSFADSLFGDGGINVLDGGAGNDVLDGGANVDILRGGVDSDTYLLDNGSDVVSDVSGLADTIVSTITRSLASYAGIERLVLTGASAINGTGNLRTNAITGNAGRNTLDGGAGNDVLNGQDGQDVLIGGAGRDVMTGGLHGDTFKFVRPTHSGTGSRADLILDFDDPGSNDKIDVSAIYNGRLDYIHRNPFSEAGQLRINDVAGADVVVEVNLRGWLGVDFSIRLKATTLASMSAGDFVL